MKELNTFLLLFSLLLFMSLTFLLPQKNNERSSLISLQQEVDTTRWIAPELANDLVNPMEADEESLLEGEMIYKKHCRSCHGKLGDGKGSGAADITTVPSNFTNPNFLEQSDGSIFWKISEGRNEKDMDPYKKKLDEEQIWIAVIYIKTFAADE